MAMHACFSHCEEFRPKVGQNIATHVCLCVCVCVCVCVKFVSLDILRQEGYDGRIIIPTLPRSGCQKKKPLT